MKPRSRFRENLKCRASIDKLGLTPISGPHGLGACGWNQEAVVVVQLVVLL